MSFHDQVQERLIRYAKVDTQSAQNSTERPTTKKQFDLACMLEKELKEIGVPEVWLDEEHCVLYGWIPANQEGGTPLGLIAHMDTAPFAPSANCRPWVLEHYDGSDIILNKEQNIVMKVETFPNLKNYIGQDLVLTDGTTLLGGDDKASIAAIMTYAEYLLANPQIKHGKICLAFTPDEEVGGLARDLDLEKFGSPTAYTLDGDYLGWYMDETFNASMQKVTVNGFSVHTGTAKGKMINAAEIICEFVGMIPADERPQNTEGREGFYHVYSLNADVEHAELEMIVRDHDSEKFSAREDYLKDCVKKINEKYGDVASIEIIPQYRSMKEVISKVPWMVEDLKAAIADCGIEPQTEPFRGGTDGSALSHRGLPCPNLSAGYENAHGRFEYVPVQSMEKNVEILLKLTERFAESNH